MASRITFASMPNSAFANLPHDSSRRLSDVFTSDQAFDEYYSPDVRKKSARHWSTLQVAVRAAEFLVTDKDVHVLDIGSGVGKFCLAAAHRYPDAKFYGVEQRKDLYDVAVNYNEVLTLHNVSFIHGNFTMLDFRQFDHFYFYNSFYENLEGADKIDDKLEYSLSLYNYYNRYLYKQLEEKPKGTRIVTFHSLEGELPRDYYTVKTHLNDTLKFWMKV